MNRRQFIGAGVAGATLPAIATRLDAKDATDGNPRRVTRLEDDWKFHLGHAADMAKDFNFGIYQRTFSKVGEATPEASGADFDDYDWARVRIPHDWVAALPFAEPKAPPPADRVIRDRVAGHGFKAVGRDFPENSIGWYRRPLPIEQADHGRSIWLEFDGVFRNCLVMVNGCIVGGSMSGYAPFQVDIGNFLDYRGGPNVVTLRVDATDGEGWFYEGAGIYRHVTLVKADAIHVPQWGSVIRATPSHSTAEIAVSTDLASRRETPGRISMLRSVVAPDGRTVATFPDAAIDVTPHCAAKHEASLTLADPALWSLETPQLYRLVTELREGGAILDRIETPFGIRAIRFDPDHGFFLNEKPVKLLGTCNHQDHSGVGTGIPDRLNAWRVEQLQSMGCNAWRSSHNPPSAALLDICDAKGMLMIVELRRNSTDAAALDELDRVVRRDRNHPCVILWSAGNEEPQQGTERGEWITAELKRRINALDPTRPVTQAFYGEDKGYGAGAWHVVDVAGLNYRTDKIDAFHAQYPKLPVIGSETASTVATRGEYRNDPVRHIVRAYDTEYPFWASTAEQWWPIVADRDYIAGGFIWTGFDYRGEPTPYPTWPSVSSQFGVLDLCGFPKDDYYYYRAWWRPNEPLVHLLPHWNWAGREGQPIEVWAHGNCDEIELVVNGVSAGRKAMPRNRHLAWTVDYRPGRIEAFGYKGGHRVASDRRDTAGPAARLHLSADRRRIIADGADLAMIKVELMDARNNPVPDADVAVSFEVTGEAKLIGVGNGNPNSHEPDQAARRMTFNGLCQALLQAGSKEGPILLSASAPGLPKATLPILAYPS
jgi:beta-galactosidase